MAISMCIKKPAGEKSDDVTNSNLKVNQSKGLVTPHSSTPTPPASFLHPSLPAFLHLLQLLL